MLNITLSVLSSMQSLEQCPHWCGVAQLSLSVGPCQFSLADSGSKTWYLLEAVLGRGEGAHRQGQEMRCGSLNKQLWCTFTQRVASALCWRWAEPENWKVDCCAGALSLILQLLNYLASRIFRCCCSDINQPLIGFGIKSTLRHWIFFSGFWSLLLMELDARSDRPFSRLRLLCVCSSLS